MCILRRLQVFCLRGMAQWDYKKIENDFLSLCSKWFEKELKLEFILRNFPRLFIIAKKCFILFRNERSREIKLFISNKKGCAKICVRMILKADYMQSKLFPIHHFVWYTNAHQLLSINFHLAL